MLIVPLGHSCFKMQESTGTTVICDPYDCGVGYTMPECSADIVTVSHRHRDHNNVAAVGGNPVILETVGCYDVKGVHITSVMSYHDGTRGAVKGKNLIFNYRIDGINVCHLGDIGHRPTPLLIEAIGTVDVLMIPVGGVYTIDAKTAKEYVDKLMPAIVIPMHYKTEKCAYDLDKVEDFLDLFDEDDVILNCENSLELHRTDFDDEFCTKVINFSI